MKIASVFPLAIVPQQYSEPLTYFANDAVLANSLVRIFFAKRKILGLVEKVDPVEAKKTALKKSTFRAKKIEAVISTFLPFPEVLVSLAKELSTFILEPAGSILKVFVPKVCLEKPYLFSLPVKVDDPFRERRAEIAVGSFEERLYYYKTVIREAFAKGKSVALFVPTSAAAEFIAEEFKELPKKVILIHGALSQKKLEAAIRDTRISPAPLLLVSTPFALGVLGGHEHVIIVEDADSPHYIRHERPHIDTKRMIKLFAEHIQARFIEGKWFPSLKDMYQTNSPHYLSSRRKQHRTSEICDLSTIPWRVFSDELAALLKANEDQTFILYVGRKGFYSFVMCLDCGHTTLCPSCGKPLVLHTRAKRHYQCHQCGGEFPLDLQCSNCNGMRLKGYGVGTEQVYRELQGRFPHRPCWIFDETALSTHKRRQAVIKDFKESRGGIIVGTELVLEEPQLTADFSAVVNIDNLFSIPDFTIHEQVFYNLVRLETLRSQSPLIIQTRFPKHPLFQFFVRQDVKGFLTSELEERKKNTFPPFIIFIKLSLKHRRHDVRFKLARAVFERIQPVVKNIIEYPSFKNPFEHIVLLALSEQAWREDEHELRKILTSFQYPWDIAVDPPTIL